MLKQRMEHKAEFFSEFSKGGRPHQKAGKLLYDLISLRQNFSPPKKV